MRLVNKGCNKELPGLRQTPPDGAAGSGHGGADAETSVRSEGHRRHEEEGEEVRHAGQQVGQEGANLQGDGVPS